MICQASLIKNYNPRFLSPVSYPLSTQNRLFPIWLIIAKWCHPEFISLRAEVIFSLPKHQLPSQLFGSRHLGSFIIQGRDHRVVNFTLGVRRPIWPYPREYGKAEFVTCRAGGGGGWAGRSQTWGLGASISLECYFENQSILSLDRTSRSFIITLSFYR